MFGKYSFPNVIKTYRNNKPLFEAYMSGKSIEGFDDSHDVSDDSEEKPKLSGASLGIFITFIVMYYILMLWAIIITALRWKRIPDWVKVLSIVCILIHAPAVSLLAVYLSTDSISKDTDIPLQSMYSCGSRR
jgi:hypothetical protein